MSKPDVKRQPDGSQSPAGWIRPAIEWEEPYEPTVFAASCTLTTGDCVGGARD